MYEYKFVRLALTGTWRIKPEQDHHAVIEQHASEGWRLVQIFAPAIVGYGHATHFESIFERPEQTSTDC